MGAPGSGREPDYALEPRALENGIGWFLDPVIEGLRGIDGLYAAARDEVVAAHASERPGWFGGEGTGEVRAASSSFLNEVAWQLQLLAGDQSELLASLRDYRSVLIGHIAWARETDGRAAERFRAIERDLDERGR
ncbi:hypothetical protein [Actinophytocola xanthii]|uniref:PE domain-containing protein n=1 Tax=Actinophytocola xanthii TaxID=1912961 RepID=A0A1Q8CYW5_9PSEU|nr:hypothetical protein [Actinophytocola xanthii]OLF19544.1 hypothetical protein BU204_01070 [Actinophytocola xanthii]